MSGNYERENDDDNRNDKWSKKKKKCCSGAHHEKSTLFMTLHTWWCITWDISFITHFSWDIFWHEKKISVNLSPKKEYSMIKSAPSLRWIFKAIEIITCFLNKTRIIICGSRCTINAHLSKLALSFHISTVELFLLLFC